MGEEPERSSSVCSFDYSSEVRPSSTLVSAVRRIDPLHVQSFALEKGLDEIRSVNLTWSAHSGIDRIYSQHLQEEVLGLACISIDVRAQP